MIRHFLMFKLKEPGEINEHEQAREELKARLDGVLEQTAAVDYEF